MIALHKPLYMEEGLMKLDEIRKLARGSKINSIDRCDKLERYTFCVVDTMPDHMVLESLKIAGDVMVERLGWKKGSELTVKESLDDNRFSIVTICVDKRIWNCDISHDKDGSVITIPNYNKVKNILGLRIDLEYNCLKENQRLHLLRVIKSAFLEKCKWPSNSSVFLERDMWKAIWILQIQDGIGNILFVPSSDKMVEMNKVIRFDIPHYDAGKLNKEQYERFIHLMLNKSVIKEEGDKKNED